MEWLRRTDFTAPAAWWSCRMECDHKAIMSYDHLAKRRIGHWATCYMVILCVPAAARPMAHAKDPPDPALPPILRWPPAAGRGPSPRALRRRGEGSFCRRGANIRRTDPPLPR